MPNSFSTILLSLPTSTILQFPLQYVFHRAKYDDEKNKFDQFGPPMKISLQEGSVSGGISLPFASTEENDTDYRLHDIITDSNGIILILIHWMILSKSGGLVNNATAQEKTLYMKIQTD
ncbi:unnamed protein product [Adineta steineri]|uniref:Uncharacterized protein n=1 Tax=Adineta steineri TaxID=433720 RepID=A0A815TV16_9BILA|nr:unnamed protein product [Adineta steineri]